MLFQINPAHADALCWEANRIVSRLSKDPSSTEKCAEIQSWLKALGDRQDHLAYLRLSSLTGMHKIRTFDLSFIFYRTNVDASEIMQVIRNHTDHLDQVICTTKQQHSEIHLKPLQNALSSFKRVDKLELQFYCLSSKILDLQSLNSLPIRSLTLKANEAIDGFATFIKTNSSVEDLIFEIGAIKIIEPDLVKALMANKTIKVVFWS